MMKAVLIALLALLPEMALSQNQVTKVVRLHYANPQVIAALVSPGSNVAVSADNTLKVIVLRGESTHVATVEQTIHELDAPATATTSKDIELLVSVIGASNSPDVTAAAEMPGDMAPVVKQLQAIFPYKNYQLLSSMLVRSREGSKAESKGIMKAIGSSSHPSNYHLAYDNASVASEDAKPMIHLSNFRFYALVPIGPVGSDVGVTTDVDLREGQKTVIGKADIGSSDSALFVVLTARLVD